MKKKEHCHYCGQKLVEKMFEGRQRHYCNQCQEPLYENPTPATCIVVVDKENKILLVKRNVEPKSGFWCLPGGFIELGENPDVSALRELKEETGLSGQIDRLLGVTSTGSTQYDTVLMVGYHVKQFTGDLKAGDDASDACFFNIQSLPEIAFDSHTQFIQTYLQTIT